MLRIYALLIFFWACGEDPARNKDLITPETGSEMVDNTSREPNSKTDKVDEQKNPPEGFKPYPRRLGITKTSRATAYYPSNSPMEGGFKDRFGNPLRTLQDFLEGKASYVSVAMDKNLNIPNGQLVRIPEIDHHFKRQIIFRVVDTGGAFTGKGYSRIDICVRSYPHSIERVVNQNVTLIFP